MARPFFNYSIFTVYKICYNNIVYYFHNVIYFTDNFLNFAYYLLSESLFILLYSISKAFYLKVHL